MSSKLYWIKHHGYDLEDGTPTYEWTAWSGGARTDEECHRSWLRMIEDKKDPNWHTNPRHHGHIPAVGCDDRCAIIDDQSSRSNDG